MDLIKRKDDAEARDSFDQLPLLDDQKFTFD